tara:strand:+ start:314 stop:418 length:105 start_codon:yes stop_codon:yes gene_type:complete
MVEVAVAVLLTIQEVKVTTLDLQCKVLMVELPQE